MRRVLSALLTALVLLAGCGGGGTPGGSGREMRLALDGPPAGVHAGIYLAVSRGYDRAAGVTLRIGQDPPDVRLVRRAELDPDRAVAVMAILKGELFLTTDRVTLDERPDDVRAVIEAIQRGYEETVVDPESAVAAVVAAENLDRRRLERELEAAAPRFRAGAAEFGEIDPAGLPRGTYDTSLVAPSDR